MATNDKTTINAILILLSGINNKLQTIVDSLENKVSHEDKVVDDFWDVDYLSSEDYD